MAVERHLCTRECAAAAGKILREKLGLSGTLYYMLSALEYQAAGSMHSATTRGNMITAVNMSSDET